MNNNIFPIFSCRTAPFENHTIVEICSQPKNNGCSTVFFSGIESFKEIASVQEELPSLTLVYGETFHVVTSMMLHANIYLFAFDKEGVMSLLNITSTLGLSSDDGIIGSVSVDTIIAAHKGLGAVFIPTGVPETSSPDIALKLSDVMPVWYGVNYSFFTNNITPSPDAEDRMSHENSGRKPVAFILDNGILMRKGMTTICTDFKKSSKNINKIAFSVSRFRKKTINGAFTSFADLNERKAFEEMHSRVLDGAKTKFGNPIPDDIRSRLEQECETFRKSRSAFILKAFVSAVEKAKSLGYVRFFGAIPSSLVMYSLGVTRINPIEMGLFPEVYSSCAPQLDMEAECGPRPIYNHLVTTLGCHRVAKVSKKEGGSSGNIFFVSPGFVEAEVPISKDGAVIVTAEDPSKLEASGHGIIRVNVDSSLLAVGRTLSMVQITSNHVPDIYSIPFNENEVFDLICYGNITGIQMLDTPIRRSMRRLFRPRSIDSLATFISITTNRQKGILSHCLDNISRGFDQDEKIEGDTFGVMIYYEQIMQAFNILGGLTLKESADAVTSLMEHTDLSSAQVMNLFGNVSDMTEPCNRILALKLSEEIAQNCRSFTTKSCNVSNAVFVYQTAWLKVHYPEEFKKVCSSLRLQ